MALYDVGESNFRTKERAILDTDDWTVESVFPEECVKIKRMIEIKELPNRMEAAFDGDIVVLYRWSYNQVQDYVLEYKIAVAEKGIIYASAGDSAVVGCPSVSVYQNEIRFSYTDKHYYREDRSEELERIWHVVNGQIDKGNFGDSYYPAEY